MHIITCVGVWVAHHLSPAFKLILLPSGDSLFHHTLPRHLGHRLTLSMVTLPRYVGHRLSLNMVIPVLLSGYFLLHLEYGIITVCIKILFRYREETPRSVRH